MVIVVATALALDFAAFRASELKESQPGPASQHHEQEQPAASLNGTTNGCGSADTTRKPAASTSPLANGSRGVGSGENGGAVVAVRPGRRPATDAERSRVQVKRAWILAAWILGALACHRWVCVKAC